MGTENKNLKPGVIKMTTQEAKKIISQELKRLNLPDYKLKAKNVDFTDLGRGSMIFVKIINWTPNVLYSELEKTARENGFRME